MNKRFASLAVSALLLVSLLSVPALAEGTEAAADAAGDDHVAEIASTGHSPMQVPQATQESVIL